jgi:hypothetical protein
MPDESEELKKLKGDFAMVLEVLRSVLRKSQEIQTTGEELKQANELLSALLGRYQVPPIPPLR